MRLQYIFKASLGMTVAMAASFMIIVRITDTMSTQQSLQRTEVSAKKNTVSSVNKEISRSDESASPVSTPATAGSSTPKSVETVLESPYEEAPFDRVSDDKFNRMTFEQRCVFNQLEEKFSEYYTATGSNSNVDPDTWNQQMREFNQELHERLGQDVADELLK